MAGLVSIKEDVFIAKSLGRKDAADCFSMAASYRAKYSETQNFGDLELAERWYDSGQELMAKGR